MKVFHYIDIAQTIIEICSILRRQIFCIKKESAPALIRERKSIYLEKFGQWSLPRLILSFLVITRTQTLDMILADCKLIPDLPLMSKALSINFAACNFIKNEISDIDVSVWILWNLSANNFINTKTPPQLLMLRNFSACNFTKNETPPQIFSNEFWDFYSVILVKRKLFWEIFYPTTLIKTRIRHSCFPVNFKNFFSLQLH